MKPDWKDAPEWAQWLAQDMDGSWYWYKKEPKFLGGGGFWGGDGKKASFAMKSEKPTPPIEQRPE